MTGSDRSEMYFYIDESGNTGINIFDQNQPVLYYGVLSSKVNIDIYAKSIMEEIHATLGVEKLHANELGLSKLAKIADKIIRIHNDFDINFDLNSVVKVDYALICFFDQVFDQGNNPAIPWTTYWTPLRYIILLKVASLFDLQTLQLAWDARIQSDTRQSKEIFQKVCQILISRIKFINDQRSREIIHDGLYWALNNFDKILYNVNDIDAKNFISPNISGFQHVMIGIASKIKNENIISPTIIVDKQNQFNKSQKTLAEMYAELSEYQFDLGTGLPTFDFTGMPHAPLIFSSGSNSVGLELVNIYLWLSKKIIEKKELSREFLPIFDYLRTRSTYVEVSLKAIEERWTQWFANLPEPTPEQIEMGKKILEIDETRRVKWLYKNTTRRRHRRRK